MSDYATKQDLAEMEERLTERLTERIDKTETRLLGELWKCEREHPTHAIARVTR